MRESYELLEYYTEYERFLDKVHAVYVAVPHHLHYELVKRALLKGKHVLCEKPLALSREEVEELFLLAAERGCVLLEALKTAFFPAFQQLIGVAESGVIGSIKAVDAAFTKLIEDDSSREFDPMQAGGAWTELGAYPVFVIGKLLGDGKPPHPLHDLQEAGNGRGPFYAGGFPLSQCGSLRHGRHRSQAGGGPVRHGNARLYLRALPVVEDGDV